MSDNTISFEVIKNLKDEHSKINSGNENNNELLIYLYEILDNINKEIIKQNKQRIKAKYGSLLPPSSVNVSSNRNNDDIQTSAGERYQRRVSKKNNGSNMNKKIYDTKYSNKYNNKNNKYNNDIKYGASSITNLPFSIDYSNNKTNDMLKFRDDNNDINKDGKQFITKGVGAGMLSQLLGVDKIKLAINRELNKLSLTNIDIIYDSINDIFTSWLLDELNQSECDIDKLHNRYQNYMNELWENIIGKSLSQPNMTEVYFKYLKKIINNPQAINNGLKSKSSVVASKLINWQPGFQELYKSKELLTNEIMTFLRTNEYFNTMDTELGNMVGVDNLNNIQQAFTILGIFTRYFMNNHTGRGERLSSTDRDIMLLGIYDNFKLLNELLYWEPVNLEDVERRVFFMVGFLEDNKGFIQSLDTDFYRDIECELDSIKRCASIPVSIKYKLFDCIDNFILTRKSVGSNRR